jgi:hypothetical protein
VTAAYFEAFESARGEKPLFDGAEGKAVQRLLKKCDGDADRACEIITKTYAATNWWRDKTTILEIARDPQKRSAGTGGGASRPGSGRGPAQPNQTERPSWLRAVK